VAPSTGLAFAATGVGTMAVAGAGTWPMNAFVGAGIHQRLSRAFFPITAGIMLVVTLGMAWLNTHLHVTLGAATLIGFSLVIMGIVTNRVARSIGAVLESSEHAREVADRLAQSATAEVEISRADQRSLEEQLRQSQKMEAIGRLAGGVAHDFNNLLAVILSYAGLLRSGDISPEAREDLQEIVRAAERAAQLTGQLLAFSRQQVLAPRIVQVGESLTSLDKMRRRLLGEDIELVVACAQNLGKIRVDPGQLDQVIMNLVVNSRDALPHGGRITVEAENVEWESNDAVGRLDAQPG